MTDQILELLEDGGKRSGELASLLHVSAREVAAQLNALAVAGAVRRQGPWWVRMNQRAAALPGQQRTTIARTAPARSQEPPAPAPDTSMPSDAQSGRLDAQDHAILRLLSLMGPQSAVDLARNLGWTPSSTLTRVNSLYALDHVTRGKVGNTYVFRLPSSPDTIAETMATSTGRVIDGQEYEVAWSGRGPLPGSSDTPGLGASLSVAVGYKVHV